MTTPAMTAHTHEPSLSLVPGCPRCEEIAGHLREERFDEAAAARREDARVEPGAAAPHEPDPADDEPISLAAPGPALGAAAASDPAPLSVEPVPVTPPAAVYPPRPTPAYCWLCSGAHDILACPRKEAILQAGDQGAQVIRSVMKERGVP
jgi:hypothetical protein